MSTEQWDAIQADISAIRLLLFSLAKSSPDSKALHAVFQECKELHDTMLLNGPLSEAAMNLKQRKISEIEKAIWG